MRNFIIAVKYITLPLVIVLSLFAIVCYTVALGLIAFSDTIFGELTKAACYLNVKAGIEDEFEQ